MLRGRYGDTSGRPYIEGRILLPRLRARSDISFCIDTGADKTILLPSDCIRMNLDYGALQGASAGVGLGGSTTLFEEEAVIAFREGTARIFVYELKVKIARDDRDMRDLPSLLGRDIINQWRINYNPTRQQLFCYPISASTILAV